MEAVHKSLNDLEPLACALETLVSLLYAFTFKDAPEKLDLFRDSLTKKMANDSQFDSRHKEIINEILDDAEKLRNRMGWGTG